MKRNAARRATGVTAAVLALLIGAPIAGPASADEPSAAERQAWSLEEAREHSDEFFGRSGTDVDLVPATDLDPDSAGSDDAATPAMPESQPESITFPEPGSTTLNLPDQAADGASARSGAAAGGEVSGKAGGLAVTVRVPGTGSESETHGTGAVRVTNVDRAAAHAAGASGGLLTIEQAPEATRGEAEAAADVPTTPGPVEISVDVSYLAGAGGDLAHRLRLVELPACALITPENAECRTSTPVENADLEYGDDGVPEAVTGTVSLAAEDSGSPLISRSASSSDAMSLSPLRTGGKATVLAVMAEASSSTGDWGATQLSPSAMWDVSTQTGSFSWSYPMRTSPVPGGLAPDLSLSYSSGGLDGRVASTNNQSSQIGDGWAGDFLGYIERKYVPCTEDQSPKNGQAANNASRDTGDLCWRSNNATLMFNGSATELVRDGNTDTWRPKDDDNSVVSHVTGGWNTADNPEYWKLTTADGTQYWFGRAKRSADDTANMSSTDVVPVYGNHPGEPCYNAAFADSRCSTGWRWNLDYVVDTSGNSMTYYYQRHNNRYGYNNNEGTQPYNRASQLERIEYGSRDGDTTTPAPAKVVFSYAERCLVTSTFDCAESKLTDANSARWPDVPQDQLCSTSTSCPDVTSPAFFDRKRLTGVTTQVRKSSAYVDVDHWSLGQTFPNPGDGTTATLWLDSITHTGRGGSAADVNLPAVTFEGRQLDNRVDETGDHGPAMTRWRIDQILSESGGLITVNYSPKQCSSSNLPGTALTDLATNDMRCQPVYWTPVGFEDPVLDWFHHYRVTSVVENAQAGGHSAPVETNYLYGTDGPKWHYDDNELVRPKHRTWGELRGYAIVSKYVGATGDSNAPRVRTRYHYFQGMFGDRDGAGGTKSVKVDGIDDLDHFSGMVRQEWSYRDESAVAETTLSTPWRSISSATDPESGNKSFHTGVQETETQTALASGGNRTSRQTTKLDSIGMPEAVSDVGNVSVTGDERCTRTTYVRNAGDHILDTAERVTSHSKSCDVAAALGDLVSDERFAYDSQNVGVVPTKGRITLHQEMNAEKGSTPVPVDVEKSKYNTYGQLIEQTDANGNATATDYDNTSGLTTKVTVTSPDPDGSGALGKHVTTTD